MPTDPSPRVETDRFLRRGRIAMTVTLATLLLAAAMTLGSGGDDAHQVTAAGPADTNPDAASPIDVDHREIPVASLTGRTLGTDPTDGTGPAPDAGPDTARPAPKIPTAAPDAGPAPTVIEIPVDEPVQMIGFSWTGSPGAGLSWRATIDGTPTPWTRGEHSTDEAPDESPRNGFGPIHLDRTGATAIEILLDTELEDLRVHLLGWDPDTIADAAEGDGAVVAAPDRPAAPAPMAAPAAAPGRAPAPTIRARSTWITGGWANGNAGCSGGPERVSSVQHAVVHHSAGRNDYTAAEVPSVMAAIHTYHTQGRGWCDFAYNYAIDRFGRIWEGRLNNGGDVVGGHAAGFNATSVGVVVLGQHHPGETPTPARPPAATLDALEALLAWKLGANGLDPTGTARVRSTHSSSRWPAGTLVTLPVISGHRDVGHTSCPGDHLFTKLPSVRTGAKARIVTTPTTTTTTRPTTTTTTIPNSDRWWFPFPDIATFTDRQARDFLGRSADGIDIAAVRREFERTGGLAAPVLWFATRPEVAETTDAAIRLHLAWHDRPPTPSELEELRDARRRGTDPETIAAGFLETGGAGALDDTEFVERLLENTTGTPVDGGRRAELLDRIRAGTAREAILIELASDPGFVARNEPAVRIIVVHHGLLGTVPAADDLDGLITATAPAVAADILSSPDYRRRIGTP